MEPLIINDHSKIEEVYKKSEEYLKTHNELKGEIGTHLWAYMQSIRLVPETLEVFGFVHFFPFAESYYELENSFELCKQGFYRHSFFTLRCVLELGVIGLYFDKDDQAHADIQKWIHSKDPTPHFQSSINRLFQFEHFYQFNKIKPLLKGIYDIYSSLSDYVHTRGFRYSTSGQRISNFNQFNEISLLHYVDSMKKTVNIIIIMMLLKYPIGMQILPIEKKFGFNAPIAGLLDETSRESILAVLDEDTKAVLQKISDNDPIVNASVKEIMNLPELTEAQIKRQIAERNKWLEEH